METNIGSEERGWLKRCPESNNALLKQHLPPGAYTVLFQDGNHRLVWEQGSTNRLLDESEVARIMLFKLELRV